MFSLLLLALTLSPMLLDTTDALPYYPAGIDTVAVEGQPVAYYDAGGDGSPLLFIHGLGSNLSFWRGVLPAFAEDHRVLALDLPGYGLSGKDDVPGTMTGFADAVAGFLDALGVEQAHVVGLSMGGQVGLTFALRHPEKLRRLVLVSPAGIETFTDAEAATLKGMMTPAAIRNTTEAQLRQNVALNFADYDSTAYGWIIEQRAAVRDRPDFAGYAQANARAVAGMLDEPVAGRLGEVEAPTLVLFGTGDRLIPNRYLHPEMTTAGTARTAEKLPNARLQMVEEAGHLLMLEQPDVFTQAVQTFLQTEAAKAVRP